MCETWPEGKGRNKGELSSWRAWRWGGSDVGPIQSCLSAEPSSPLAEAVLVSSCHMDDGGHKIKEILISIRHHAIAFKIRKSMTMK